MRLVLHSVSCNKPPHWSNWEIFSPNHSPPVSLTHNPLDFNNVWSLAMNWNRHKLSFVGALPSGDLTNDKTGRDLVAKTRFLITARDTSACADHIVAAMCALAQITMETSYVVVLVLKERKGVCLALARTHPLAAGLRSFYFLLGALQAQASLWQRLSFY